MAYFTYHNLHLPYPLCCFLSIYHPPPPKKNTVCLYYTIFCPKEYLYFNAASYRAIADQAGKDSRCKQPYNAIFPDIFSETHCSIIFSINIPYPLLASCTNTWVTAPASFPSCIIGLPLTSKSSKGQQFYSLFSYTLKSS